MFVSGPVLYRVPAFALARSSDLRLVRFQKERPGSRQAWFFVYAADGSCSRVL